MIYNLIFSVCLYTLSYATGYASIGAAIQEIEHQRFLEIVRKSTILPGYCIEGIDPDFSPSLVAQTDPKEQPEYPELPCTFEGNESYVRVKVPTSFFHTAAAVASFRIGEAECIQTAWSMAQKGACCEEWDELKEALLARNKDSGVDDVLLKLAHKIPKQQGQNDDLKILTHVIDILGHLPPILEMPQDMLEIPETDVLVIKETVRASIFSPNGLRALFSPTKQHISPGSPTGSPKSGRKLFSPSKQPEPNSASPSRKLQKARKSQSPGSPGKKSRVRTSDVSVKK